MRAVVRERLLDLPAPVAARRIALGFLQAARRARRRLRMDRDDQALHDFRVALRRLRSTLRAYRPWLDNRLVSRKLHRRLKRVTRATGAARDAEVGLVWLQHERQRLGARARVGCDRMVAELKARRAGAYDEIRQRVADEFDALDARLGAALRGRAGVAHAPRLGPAVGGLMREQIDALLTELGLIASVTGTKSIHSTRIEAKRLRYLLEPLVPELANGAALLHSLKCLQEEFGELCDRQVLARELIETAARHGAERAARRVERVLSDGTASDAPSVNVLPGLLALAERVNAERMQRWRGITRRYLGRHTAAFLGPYRALAEALAHPPPLGGARSSTRSNRAASE